MNRFRKYLHPSPRTRCAPAIALVILFAISSRSPAAQFSAPQRLTDGAADTMRYRLSRTANNIMGVDSQGVLHTVYWSGQLATTPSSPSFVYYRSWTVAGGWSAQTAVDDSEISGMGHIGGRHPSLVVTPGDKVWIAWHDHRHSTALNSYIDNIEIYADFMTPSVPFSNTDLRLTNTSAIHDGDNGFTPNLVVDPSGRLSMGWHDFHFDRSFSDIFLKTSDAGGDFNLAEPIASQRMTDVGARGGATAFTVPDLALDASGARHMVWVDGQGSDGGLYYAQAALGATSVAEQQLAAAGASFFDPPHIVVAPNDDVWIVYADHTPAAENIILLRRRAGQPNFDSPITARSGPQRQFAPDIEFLPGGLISMVWLEGPTTSSDSDVYFGRFNPDTLQWVEEIQLTNASEPYARPSLLLDGAGGAYVLFEERVGGFGDIWFTHGSTFSGAADRHWTRFE